MKISREQLYEEAFKYKKTGLWKKLWDNEIFAVRLNYGEIGYICTLGKDSGLNALGVFIGDEGFNSYRIIEELKASDAVPPLRGLEIITMQACLQVDFVEGKSLTPEEREEAPYYPFLLMIVNREDYFVLQMSLFDHVEEKPQELLQEYANAWRNNHICPREIRCRDERTIALLKDFSEKTGAKISIYDGELVALDELQRAFMAYPNEDYKEETLEEMAEIIQEILTMPEEKLMTMPEELQEYLWTFIEDGMFPDDIAEELRRRLEMIPE